MSWDNESDSYEEEQEYEPATPSYREVTVGEPEKKKIRLPLLYAFPISIVVSLIIMVIFDLAGAEENGMLEQIEIILVTIGICGTGILTRSKLRSFLNLFAAPIIYLIPYVIGFPYNPWGHFDKIGVDRLADLKAAVVSADLEELKDVEEFIDTLQTYGDYGFIIDLIILLFFPVLIGGFFYAMIATGFWRDDGKFSIISLISKPIAVIFVLIFAVAVPISYLGIARFTEGTMALGISGTYAMGGFNELSGENVSSIDQDKINTAFNNAADWMETAVIDFSAVGDNFVVDLLIFPLVDQLKLLGEGGSVEGMYDATIDFMDGAKFSLRAIPKLIDGFIDLKGGMDIALPAINIDNGGTRRGISQGNDSIDVETFNQGLLLIQEGIISFEAAETEIDAAITKLLAGIDGIKEHAGELEIIETLDTVSNNISSIQGGVPIAIDVAKAVVPFLNATFYLNQARQFLSDNDFFGAIDYLREASNNLDNAVTLLTGAKNTMEQGDMPVEPIPQVVYAIIDVSSVINDLTRGALSLADMFNSLSNVAELIGGAELTDLSDPYFRHSPGNLTDADNHINLAYYNFTKAKSRAAENSTDNYSGFQETINPVFTQISDMIGTFEGNLSDGAELIGALRYTNNAFIDFGRASLLFNESLEYVDQYILTFSEPFNATGFIVANHTYHLSYDNGTLAEGKAQNTTAINANTKSKLLQGLNVLKLGAIAGIAGSEPFIPIHNKLPGELNATEIGYILGNSTAELLSALANSTEAQDLIEQLFGITTRRSPST
ncbi:MAG: hypothetical protein ACFFDT_29120, partial [Candidatus Hodarchaeota archaeon]